MEVWDSRAGEKLLDLGNVLRCSRADWLRDRMGGSEGKGRNHGWLLTAGFEHPGGWRSFTGNGGRACLECCGSTGTKNSWYQASICLPRGGRWEKAGRKWVRGEGTWQWTGQKPRAQNSSNNSRHAALYTGLVKFSQYEQPFYPHVLLYFSP